MIVFLESAKKERKKSTDTAEAEADEEPDKSKGRGGGGHGGRYSGVTGGAELCFGIMDLSILKDMVTKYWQNLVL